MQDGQKFNNTLQGDGQLTRWMECHVRRSEIQQHLARRRLTHKLDGMSCEMVRNSTTPRKMTVDSPTEQNFAPYYLLPNATCYPPTLTGCKTTLVLASFQRGCHYLSLYLPIFIQYQQKLYPRMPVPTYYDIHKSVRSKIPLIIPHSHP